jgi:hypothetical protein
MAPNEAGLAAAQKALTSNQPRNLNLQEITPTRGSIYNKPKSRLLAVVLHIARLLSARNYPLLDAE